MSEIDVNFCFYDDPDYLADADRDSRRLRTWHQILWSKALPHGDELRWAPEPGSLNLIYTSRLGDIRVSSDTIASTHSNYQRLGGSALWSGLTEEERARYDRSFYTIGGFIIFPTRPQSLNQRRGTAPAVADRFDLTLECIRQHFLGRAENPLADVLLVDADYFQLFGVGATGFDAFVDFFFLQDLVSDGSIRWFDGHQGHEWDFARAPLPTDLGAYRAYLDNVHAFVTSRNGRIREWCNQ